MHKLKLIKMRNINFSGEKQLINFIKTNLEKKFPFLKEKNVPKYVMQCHISEFMGMDYGYESLPFKLIDLYNLVPFGCENFLYKYDKEYNSLPNDKEIYASCVIDIVINDYL